MEVPAGSYSSEQWIRRRDGDGHPPVVNEFAVSKDSERMIWLSRVPETAGRLKSSIVERGGTLTKGNCLR